MDSLHLPSISLPQAPNRRIGRCLPGAPAGGWRGEQRLNHPFAAIEPLESRIAPAAAVFELSSLDGNLGFTIAGVAAGDYAGDSVSDAGDVNGDGFGDLIVGAVKVDRPNETNSGASYVVFGKAGGFPARLELSTLDGTNGFKLSGVATGDQSGGSVSAAGDVNGDGFDDVIIGAGMEGGDGASYVVFGKANGFAANLELSALNGINGFRLNGRYGESAATVSGAGDLNGDGFADLVVGAYRADINGDEHGASYVVFGKPSGFAADINLAALDGGNGFKVSGVAEYDYSGSSVSAAGDLNGDGFDDLIIGARGADPNGSRSGASYVVLGKAGGFTANLNLSNLDGSNGFKLSGVAANDYSGVSVSAAGDVNGDGFGDVIIGTRPDFNFETGSSYVVFGKAGGFAANLNLSDLDGSNGFKVSGVAPYDYSGSSVSSAGDFNGDGFDDVIIGASGADANGVDSGAAYLILGKASGFGPNLELSELDGTNGFKLSGVAQYDDSGLSVSTAGDINGDGFDDLIIGSRADPNGGYSGASYVVFGRAVGGAQPAITINDVTVAEGASGKVMASFNVSLSEPSTQAVTVQYATASGTASTPQDYGALALATLTFAPGEIMKTVLVEVNGDTTVEPDETFFVNLSSPANATVLDAQGQGTIQNDDAPSIPALSIDDVRVIETAGGTVTASFTVSLSEPSSQTVTVQYATANGTATAPEDYIAAELTTLSFNPGEISKTVVVTVRGDGTLEPDETFFLDLSSPVNATLADPQGLGTILNDDVDFDISPKADSLTFTDVDGDKVTVQASKGSLSALNFIFGAGGTLQLIDLKPEGNEFSGANLQIRVQQSAGGDGVLNVGAINATGINLGEVNIRGDVGQIDVGDGLGKAMKSLTVGSLGAQGAATQPAGTLNPLLSEIRGSLPKLTVQRDVKDAIVEVSDKLGKVLIGGSLIDSGPPAQPSRALGSIEVFNNGGIPPVSASRAGALFAPNIGPVTVVGDINGGEITAEVEIKSVKIVGRLMSLNPLDPAILRAGTAINKIVINDDVQNALILAGYARDLKPRNPDASIGKVVVNGDWTASSVVAGVADPSDNGFGIGDTIIAGDATPALVSRIASVIIKGTATGSATLTDHSAITAQKIGALRIDGAKVPLTGGADNVPLDTNRQNFRAVEIVS